MSKIVVTQFFMKNLIVIKSVPESVSFDNNLIKQFMKASNCEGTFLARVYCWKFEIVKGSLV